MTNTPIKSRSVLETQPGAVVHTDVVEMNVTSVGGDRNFVSFIDEAYGHLGNCHLKTKGRDAGLLKQHTRWVE